MCFKVNITCNIYLMISHNKYIYFAYQNITKIDDVMK